MAVSFITLNKSVTNGLNADVAGENAFRER